MNNQTALLLALALAIGVILDQVLLDGMVTLFLGRQWLSLINWLAVWR